MDAQRAWDQLKEGRLVFDRKLIQDWWNDDTPRKVVVGETIASQLPGRQNGGAADAYRHILLSAEFTRRYGPDVAYHVLTNHELDAGNGADNGLDMWNNSIGIRIGQYVQGSDGDWSDVVRLSRAVLQSSFKSGSFAEVAGWKKRKADDGIRKAYQQYLETHKASLRSRIQAPMSYAEFSKRLNRSYAFRAREGEIVLEGGQLKLDPVAMTSSHHWRKHPKVMVNGKEVELSVNQSQFPSDAWLEGQGFVYEAGNAAPNLTFTPEDRRRTLRSRMRAFPLENVPDLPGAAEIPSPDFDKTAPAGAVGLPSERDPEAALLFLPDERASLESAEQTRSALANTPAGSEFSSLNVVGPGQAGPVRQTSFDRYRSLGTDPAMAAQAAEEYLTLLRQAYVDLAGDLGAAEILATERFGQVWGLSDLASVASGTVLKHPAEKVYPAADGDPHGYLRSEAEQFLKAAGIAASRLYLTPNDKTGTDWLQGGRDTSGFGPRLTLSYDDADGMHHLATDHFQARLPDPI